MWAVIRYWFYTGVRKTVLTLLPWNYSYKNFSQKFTWHKSNSKSKKMVAGHNLFILSNQHEYIKNNEEKRKCCVLIEFYLQFHLFYPSCIDHADHKGVSANEKVSCKLILTLVRLYFSCIMHSHSLESLIEG